MIANHNISDPELNSTKEKIVYKKSSSHSFDIQNAILYGTDCAILITHFQYWIDHNQKMERNLHDDKTWMYQSRKEMSAHFPYWNEDYVRRLTDKLVQLDVLIKGNYNKSKFDTTLWYAFKNEEMFTMGRFANSAVKSATSIPYTIPTNKKNPPPPSSKVPKEKPNPKTKPIPKNPLRGEEEDSSIEEKKKALSQIELTEKNKTRVAKKYTLEEILIAIEIFLTQEIKSNPMGLLLSILDNPQNWEKKVVKKNKDELDKEKEAYRERNRLLADSYTSQFSWKVYRPDTNFVKFTTRDTKFDFTVLFYDDPNFDKLFNKAIQVIPPKSEIV